MKYDQLFETASDGAIPPAGTEHCDSALTIEGRTYECELQPPHSGWAHHNMQVRAVWS